MTLLLLCCFFCEVQSWERGEEAPSPLPHHRSIDLFHFGLQSLFPFFYRVNALTHSNYSPCYLLLMCNLHYLNRLLLFLFLNFVKSKALKGLSCCEHVAFLGCSGFIFHCSTTAAASRCIMGWKLIPKEQSLQKKTHLKIKSKRLWEMFDWKKSAQFINVTV